MAVGAPADELRRVPEACALHVVVADLEHALDPQRDEREVLAGVPAAAGAAAPRRPSAAGRQPAPRVLVERAHERLQLGEQLAPPRGEGNAPTTPTDSSPPNMSAHCDAGEWPSS